MKMAKASEEEIFALNTFMQKIEEAMQDNMVDPVDFCAMVEEEFNTVAGGWRRVVWGCLTLIQNCCDPDADTLEWKPEIAAVMEQNKEAS